MTLPQLPLDPPPLRCTFCAIYDALDVPAKMRGRWNGPFKADLTRARLVGLRGATVLPESAQIHSDPAQPTSLPTATVRVTIKPHDGPPSSSLIHLTASGRRYSTDPFPLHWTISAITPEDTS